MHARIVRGLVGTWCAVAVGCQEQEESPGPVRLYSGTYVSDTLNLMANTCGSLDNPLESIRVESDFDAPEMLTFPDLTIGGEAVPMAAATLVDGVFTLEVSVPLTYDGYDSDKSLDYQCVINDFIAVTVRVVDDYTLDIEMGEQRLEPVAGPVDLCGPALGDYYSIPGYNHTDGCQITFTSTMKRTL